MYITIVTTILRDLDFYVSKRIKEGFIPVGGPFVTVNNSYAQAMWKVRDSANG